jgi:hypothetical protein
MKLPRRKFLRLAWGAAALPAMSRIAWPQAYPSLAGFFRASCYRLVGAFLRRPSLIEHRVNTLSGD